MVLWVILICYILLMIGIGVYCSKKASNVNDFVLGGRSVGAWFTAFAFGTSYFSAVIFIGYAGQFGWKYGVASTWIGIGNAVIGSLLAWVLLGRRTRIMTKQLDCSTMPEFFEKRYNSKALKIVSAMIVFIFLIPYTASVYNGLSRLFEQAFHIDYSICIIAMAILTAVYVILGGYKATAINDFVQGIIMLVGISMVVVLVVNSKGGLSSALASLGQIPDEHGNLNSYNSVFGPNKADLLGVVILTSLGTWGLPQMATKFYAIKDDDAIKRGTIISTLFAVIVAGGSYFMGGFGRLFVNAEDITVNGKLAYDVIVPTMLNDTLPEILIGVVVVLVLSASMSTLSSLVLTSSSTLTIDMIKPFMKKGMDEKKQVLVMRILIAVFLIISVIIALNKNTYISTLMSISWGALAGSFLAPYLYGLFSKKITKPAVWVSFASGVGITVAHMFIFTFGGAGGTFLGFSLASPINAGAFAMLFGLIIVPIVSLFTKQKDSDKENTEKLFAECFNK
ncbi:MAG: sodium:solute symporter [Oscillospiraceae bacterium]